MSEGKVAAQASHAVSRLRANTHMNDEGIQWNYLGTIVVLKVSDKKFFEKIEELEKKYNAQGHFFAVQIDRGLTELEENTPTAIAYYEE